MRKYFNGLDVAAFDALPDLARILDYGCGRGAVSRYLLGRGFRVVAVDVDPACEQDLRRDLSAEENGRLRFFSIRKDKPFPAQEHGMFDCIICREVLEHVDDPADALALFSSLLADNGLLVVSVPTYWSERYFSLWDPDWLRKSGHLRIFRRKDMQRLFSSNRLLSTREEGQSFRWTLFWLMLSPFRVKHTMGNPESHRRLVKLALTLTEAVCSVPMVERIGNRLLPKSRFHYGSKRKPRILVVYDFRDWILGKWAANIARIYGKEFDVVTISMFHADADQSYAARLVDKVDIVHLLLPHPYPLFRKLARERAIITTIHHWLAGGEDYAAAALGSERLVTGAKQWKDRLSERGVPRDHITVVHSGIEDRFFQPRPGLIAESSKLTCGFFAKWSSNESDRKGARHLLRLAENMRTRSAGDRFRLVISGPGWEESVAALRNAGVETVYLPYVEDQDMPALFRSLDVYLMLSDVEGGPVTIAEAMASGCLVFSTNVGVAGEIVTDEVTGLLIDTSEVAAIVDKLLYFQANPDARLAICAHARRFADEHMRNDRTMAPLGGLYREVLSLGKRPGEGELNAERENATTDANAASIAGAGSPAALRDQTR